MYEHSIVVVAAAVAVNIVEAFLAVDELLVEYFDSRLTIANMRDFWLEVFVVIVPFQQGWGKSVATELCCMGMNHQRSALD